MEVKLVIPDGERSAVNSDYEYSAEFKIRNNSPELLTDLSWEATPQGGVILSEGTEKENIKISGMFSSHQRVYYKVPENFDKGKINLTLFRDGEEVDQGSIIVSS